MSASQELLQALGRVLGIDNLVYDESGRATLSFDDVAVTFQNVREGNGILIYSVLDQLLEGDNALPVAFLEANAFFQKTAGASFALVEDAVLLQYLVDAQQEKDKSLAEKVEAFVNLCVHWRKEIVQLRERNRESDGGPGEHTATGVIFA